MKIEFDRGLAVIPMEEYDRLNKSLEELKTLKDTLLKSERILLITKYGDHYTKIEGKIENEAIQELLDINKQFSIRISELESEIYKLKGMGVRTEKKSFW